MLTPKNREGKKKCKCGNEFVQYRSTQNKCTPCLIEKGRKINLLAVKKANDKRKSDWIKEKKVLKEGLKRLPEYKAEARKFFQKWVRLRDENQPCISCDKTVAKQWDGGHYLKAEIYSGLIFDEDNCHKQCSHCNDYLAGNYAEYRKRLEKRIGLARLTWLEQNKDRLRVYKYSKEELTEIKEKYKLKIKNKNYGN